MKSMIGRVVAFLGVTALLTAGVVSSAHAQVLQRLSADFQNDTSTGGAEISTTAPALPGGAGGINTYSKTLSVPFANTLFITFSAQGDVHNGSALLMNATVTENGSANKTPILCQPLLGQTSNGGGGPHVQTGWYTLLHLPEPSDSTGNCNDGGGGTADCHDNNLVFSCCERITPDRPTFASGRPGFTTHTVNLNLADLPGGDSNIAFYERATINIDGVLDLNKSLCQGAPNPSATEDAAPTSGQ